MTPLLHRNAGKRGAAAIAAFATILLSVVTLVASGSDALDLPAWVDFIAAIATVAAASYFGLASRRARSEAALAETHLATLQRQLECDPLTHLMNRTAFNKAARPARAPIVAKVQKTTPRGRMPASRAR